MPGSVRGYFKDFVDTQEGFQTFHNQVINMPRESFDNKYFKKLQSLAFYLSLAESEFNAGNSSYKIIMKLISDKISTISEDCLFRNKNFENDYFIYNDLDRHYKTQGRMFRHLMETCALWGMIKSSAIIDFDRCKDFISLSEEQIPTFLENISLGINIKDNNFIKSLSGIETIRSNADYRPTLGILKYLKDIAREATDFELSVLLGRIDKLQDESLIIQRALDIGRWFNSSNRNGQQQEFFREMGWKYQNGILFRYRSSQQPFFKFHTYLLFLTAFGLIQKNPATNNYSLTEDAKHLLGVLPASVIDLNKLINKLNLDGGNVSDATMKDILIKTNMDTLQALLSDKNLVKTINKFVLDNPIIKKGARVRNQFIAELARIRENYQCQAGTTTFERQDGRNYVEAHHIIEFSKGGPDVLENLLALGPTPHTQLHRGSERAVRDMYIDLMGRGAIRLELFENMIDNYNCLTEEHLDFLYTKGIISSQQKTYLMRRIESHC